MKVPLGSSACVLIMIEPVPVERLLDRLAGNAQEAGYSPSPMIRPAAADTAAFTSMLATDNVQAGRIAADILAERIKKTYADAEGDVALITASPGVSALDARARGFREQLAARYGALNIVVEKIADGEAATGRRVMESVINEYSELRGVFAPDLAMVHGAAKAIAEKKANKTGDTINLVGFDWDEELIKTSSQRQTSTLNARRSSCIQVSGTNGE
jgi:ABC-type sugar transport system substrate-binding protein